MYRVYGVSSLAIFRAAESPGHNETLHNMSGCPQRVIEYMRTMLEPAAVEAHNKKLVAKARGQIAKAETVILRLT